MALFAAHLYLDNPELFHGLRVRNKSSLQHWHWHGAKWYPLATSSDIHRLKELADVWSRYGRTKVTRVG